MINSITCCILVILCVRACVAERNIFLLIRRSKLIVSCTCVWFYTCARVYILGWRHFYLSDIHCIYTWVMIFFYLPSIELYSSERCFTLTSSSSSFMVGLMCKQWVEHLVFPFSFCERVFAERTGVVCTTPTVCFEHCLLHSRSV